ncbi:MAG: SDR family NAD(P)-dependent oxidoreductase [Acidobacteria bacterium]|nr:SDR family NAD(P)-dependent oxidoreductase [Acidobacteriota bacterium]
MGAEVLITGANRGIGLEFARQFAKRGDQVVATCRDPENAAELRALDIEVLKLDVSSMDEVAAVAAVYDDRHLDVLLNNAGVGVNSVPLGDVDLDQMKDFYAINAAAPLALVQTLLPALRRGRGRTILNMTSRMGSIGDNTSGAAYSYRASKAALNAITKSLALDLAAEEFTCAVLHPGWVQTDMGGAGAPVTPADSVAGLLRVIDGLGVADSGGFFDYTGEQLPW